MNLKAFGLVCCALLTGLTSGAALFAQESPQEPQRAEAARSTEQLIKDLGSDSYKTRIAAERALRKLGKEALPALRAAAESTADAEAQWRSKRLIRQIETGSSGVEERGSPDASAPEAARPRLPDARDQFEDVFRRMERDFGVDIPRGSFFHDGFFRDLDQQFRDMQDRMQGLQGQLQGLSQGMSMQVGPGGVRVEVQEQNDKGETEKKVYEAPDMETFRKQYPDVLKQHGLMFGGGFTGFNFTPFSSDVFGDRPLPLDRTPLGIDPIDPTAPMPAPPAAGERLGVLVKPEIPAGLRQYLELDAGVGLMVESVQEDTLAASLGLEAGDIVTAIAGQAIGSPADVRQALGAIEAGKAVEVRFIRRGAGKSASAPKPAAEKAPEPAGGRVEPRRGGKIR